MKKNTHFKLSILASAMCLVTGANALEIKQQGKIILFDDLDTIQYQAKVRLPNGSFETFKITNGDFSLSAEMLGLDKLQNGLYKYELTPTFNAGQLSKDVRKLNDVDISAEYAKTYQTQNQSLTGVFTIADDILADKNLVDPVTIANTSTANKSSSGAVDRDLPPTTRDQVILDDLIVDGSACIGFDCVNGESFGFDTIRIKENNLRIRAQDTSTSASFPSNDWMLTFNDSANGGQNKFSIDDIDGGRTPFTIEASAPSHSLYVDDGGRIGIGTSTPVVEMHIVNGDSPTLRLEQNGSSGFTPQTWDVAGNEANFFVRDATNGSTLPFKIRPGAPTGALVIEASGEVSFGEYVGIGVTNPEKSLHIQDSGNVVSLLASTDGPVQFRMRTDTENRRILARNAADVTQTQIVMNNDNVIIAGATDTTNLYATFNATGLTVNGNVVTSTTTYPDYVFEKGYNLLPLDDVKSYIDANGHLPNIPSAAEMIEKGVNLTEMHIKVMEKVEELTLYSLQQHEEIKELKEKIALLSN